eukprot:NODE_3000_length_509_cov_33.878261_g2597_i0.p1 GENE.NODE_3000_length_509_cov_33.878261_g2597_i0~~NODE_3000_length_509_cov_33.878261_g2597_i0.p1  ORF type:complete len:131 (+),score=6.95 NODE_3000_length_509_cov_33.878261_g2597_i0:31-423(+)
MSGKELLERLETFFSSPGLTTAVGEFMRDHIAVFSVIDPELEQPLEYHNIYQKYLSLMEQQLSSFLTTEGLVQEDLVKAITALRDSDAGQSLCIDYLMACSDYLEFLRLVSDFQSCAQMQGDELLETSAE